MADEVEVFYENSVVEVIPATDVDVIEVVEEGPQGPEGQVGPGVDEFIELIDAPSSYTGEANKTVSVKGDESGLEFTARIDTFLELTDAPDSYVGQAFKAVTVKEDESGLEFSTNGGEGFNSTVYRFSTTITPGDPGTGKLRFDSATPASITNIFIDDLNDEGTDISAFLGLLEEGDVVYVQDQGNSANAIRFTLSGAPVDNVGWWTIPVDYVIHQGSLPNNNARVAVSAQMSPGALVSGANPTAEVGLTAVNGSAGTFMRSDAAPPLDQNISPTWTGDHVFEGALSCETPVDPENVTNKEYVDALVAPTGTYLLSGGGVAWTGTGLDFIVSAATYLINGVQYSSPQTPVTLSPADPTDDRIDVFAVDNTGTVVVVEGTPGGPPVEPQVDPATQLKLTHVTIEAGETEPAITTVDLYLENTEWNSSTNTGNINLASTNNPYAGTKDIEGTATATGNFFVLVKPSGTIVLSDYANLVFQIRSKGSWPSPKALSITWLIGISTVGSTIALKHGSFGFDSSNTSGYQQITIPIPLFNGGATLVDRIRFQVTGGGASIGWYIDNIVVQTGTGGGTTGGDFSTNTNVSVDSEIVLFSGVTGKLGKRATTTGLAKLTSGVLSAGVEGTDYLGPLRIEDEAYGVTWNGDTDHAASKNALYDKIENLVASLVTTFLSLTDAPDSYTGQGEKVVAVKATEDGLEFVTVTTAGGIGSVGFSFGKTSGIAVGKTKGFLVCPYAATITAFNFVIDTGTATVKVWKIATGTAKPTNADSINTSGVSISSGTALRSTTLTDFTTTAVAANDIFAFEITALGGSPTEIMFSLELTKT